MSDDVDPNESPTGEAVAAVDSIGTGDRPPGRDHDPVDIAMLEIELVGFEEMQPEPDVDGSETPDTQIERLQAAEPMQPAETLPTMADLDRVASELDDVDARLAALDQQRP